MWVREVRTVAGLSSRSTISSPVCAQPPNVLSGGRQPAELGQLATDLPLGAGWDIAAQSATVGVAPQAERAVPPCGCGEHSSGPRGDTAVPTATRATITPETAASSRWGTGRRLTQVGDRL